MKSGKKIPSREKEYAAFAPYDESSADILSIKKQVLDRIRPGPDERRRLEEMRSLLIEYVRDAALHLGETDVMPLAVGSAARSTWLRGNHDIDIFISFPETLSKEEMGTRGYAVAAEVAKRADSFEDRHSEHPYLHVVKDGFEVDLVPCFRIADPSAIRSAVDRTPFHCRFVKENIKGREDDVLLLKQFMKGAGVYGSEVRNSGFSGYLSELLVIYYGSFDNVVNAAAQWKPGIVIDIVGHAAASFDDPLVMIDPTDPKRNVAAAVSLDKFAAMADHARSFARRPSDSFFFGKTCPPLSDAEIVSLLRERGTHFLAVCFGSPQKADDTLYPQLFKTERSIREILRINEFQVLNTLSYGDDAACIVWVELFSGVLPPVRLKEGPPVWVHPNGDAFREKYASRADTYALFIENGHYMAEIPRPYRTAKELIAAKTGTEIALGKHVREVLAAGFDIFENDEICRIRSEGFRSALREKIFRHLS